MFLFLNYCLETKKLLPILNINGHKHISYFTTIWSWVTGTITLLAFICAFAGWFIGVYSISHLLRSVHTCKHCCTWLLVVFSVISQSVLAIVEILCCYNTLKISCLFFFICCDKKSTRLSKSYLIENYDNCKAYIQRSGSLYMLSVPLI